MALRIKSSDLAAFGIPEPPKRKASKATVAPVGEAVFRAMLVAQGIRAVCFPEFEFAKPRKWRFDWAFPFSGDESGGLGGVALEIQGGLFTGGRHVRGAALLDEQTKLNEAACRLWRVVYCTPQQVNSGVVFSVLRRAIYGE